MTVFDINDTSVDFPYEPYDIQKKYMHAVIESLKTKRCAVLESPTGTGKTISLLCSTISWVKQNTPQPLLDVFSNENTYNECSSSWENRSKIKIFYASRTHSQLSKVMTELKATNFKNLKVTILGSRDQLCVHPKVSAEPSLVTKNLLCQLHSKAKSCHFGNRVEKCKNDPSLNEIVDIEDLVSKTKKLSCCPFYLARDLQDEADIVFLPYNYLFDHNIRSNLKISLYNSIVILDEAHNVLKVCEEASSVVIRSMDITVSITEITEEMENMYRLHQEGDNSFGQTCSPDEICSVKQVLIQLEEAIKLLESKGKNIHDGSFIFEFLEMAKIDVNNYPIYASLFHRVSEMLSSNESMGGRKGSSLRRLLDTLSVIFSFADTDKITLDTCFRVFYEKEESLKKRGWESVPSLVNFWCLNPGHGMSKLLNSGVHSVVLTSGTLAPVTAFIYELNLDNPVTLESEHIIEPKQVYVNVLTKGPTGFELRYNFSNRQDKNYWKEIALCLQNYLRIIPDGVLVFLPSYAMLQKSVEIWTESGLMAKLGSLKPIFIEPTRKDELNKVMNEYKQAINEGNGRGAVLIGVCRGKVSEGLDFEDELGRAVVIIGLPFPPYYDSKVSVKRNYMDVRNATTKLMSGDLWYQLEATKAVNQAIGRVIRHSRDFGAIILCDVKFSNKSTLSNLSKWLRPVITQHHFGQSVANLKRFFTNNEGLILRKPNITLPSPQTTKDEPSSIGLLKNPVNEELTCIDSKRDFDTLSFKWKNSGRMFSQGTKTFPVNKNSDNLNTSCLSLLEDNDKDEDVVDLTGESDVKGDVSSGSVVDILNLTSPQNPIKKRKIALKPFSYNS